MYYIQSESSFDAAHFLKGYSGKCANLHGHRWRVTVSIQGPALSEEGPTRGMLRDFGDVKRDLAALTEPLDHALLAEENSLMPATLAALEAEGFRMVFFPFPTTAENLARYFYQGMTDRGYRVREAAVWETPANCAVYDGTGKERPHG